jgi:hypothetical protein
MYGWNQFRDFDGEPIYPQRELLIGLLATASTVGLADDVLGRYGASTGGEHLDNEFDAFDLTRPEIVTS